MKKYLQEARPKNDVLNQDVEDILSYGARTGGNFLGVQIMRRRNADTLERYEYQWLNNDKALNVHTKAGITG